MLKVAYVGAHLPSYFAEEYDVFKTSIEGLERLAEAFGFQLSAIHSHLVSRAEARIVAEDLEGQGIDFVLLQNSSFTMGEVVLEFAKRSFRLGIWATEEPSKSGPILLNNFVSMNLQAGVLSNYLQHPFKWFYGNPEHPWFKGRLELSMKALRVLKRLEQGRIALIGGIAPTFFNFVFDERRLRSNLGVDIFHHELDDVFVRARQQTDAAMNKVVDELHRRASERVEVSEQDMRSSAAVYLALRDLAAEYTYDALAVSDWPVFQNVMKIHPGMAFSWLDEQDRVPVASEGDVLGAISMLMMNEANAGQSLLLDMNDLDFEREAVLMWHCGGSPLGFADTQGVSWKNHSTLGRKTDAPPMGAVADYRFKPQLATLLRLGHDGKSLLAFDAEIIDSPHSGYEGSRGWLSHFQFDGQALKLADLVNTVMVEGIEHHFILGSGHQMAVFMEVAAWLNISVVRPVVYRDYLQRFSLYS